jgi:MATE family multidrug resistance protein
VGQAIGAGDIPLARRRGLMGVGLGLAVMSVCALVFVVAGAEIAGIYSSELDVIAAAVPLLLIAAVFQLFDGTQAIAAGALRGLGRTRATFVANVIGHYAIGLSVTIVLTFHFGMGAPGLWWGLSAGLIATAAFLVAWFVRATRSVVARQE